MFSGLSLSWWLCLASLLHVVTSQASINITNIQFTPGTVYSTDSLYQYTTVIVDFQVLGGEVPSTDSSGNDILIKFELPHRDDGSLYDMTIGANSQAQWLRFPGDDLAEPWVLYNTPGAPLIGLLTNKYFIQAFANSSGTSEPALPQGYVGTIRVSDVLVPQSCQYPGVYTLSIGNLTDTHRPTSNGVLCPEFENIQLSFDSSPALQYDTTNGNVTITFQIGGYPWFDLGSELVVTFPEGPYPARYVLESNIALTLGGAHNWTENIADRNVSQGTETFGEYSRPLYATTTTGGGYVNPGSTLAITLSSFKAPWNCEYNQTFCIQLGFFSGCTVVEEPVINCPVLQLTDVALSETLYHSTDVLLALTFNTTLLLLEKPKYEVKLSFPEYTTELYTAWDATSAYIVSLPASAEIEDLYAPASWNLSSTFTNSSNAGGASQYASFYLGGTNNYDYYAVGDRYIPPGALVTIVLGGITNAGNCIDGTFKLEIGPFSAELNTNIVTGCPVLTNLDLSFASNLPGAVTNATLSFNIGEYPLRPETLRLRVPYYSGAGRDFFFQCIPLCGGATGYNWVVDGEVQPTLTLYRGLTYNFTLCDNATIPTGCSLQTDLVIVDPSNPTVSLAGNNGSFMFTAPLDGPSTYTYMHRTETTYSGSIAVVERPRGLQFTNLSTAVPGIPPLGTRVTADWGVTYPDNIGFDNGQPIVYAEAFAVRTFLGNPWQSLSPPVTTYSVAENYFEYEAFHTFDTGARRVLEGYADIKLDDLVLPTDCTNIGDITLAFWRWEVTADPVSDSINCPQLSNFGVIFDTHVYGEEVTTFVTVDLAGSSLNPSDYTYVRVVLPTTSSLQHVVGQTANIVSAFGWNLGGSTRENGYWESSVEATIVSGTPVAPGTIAVIQISGLRLSTDNTTLCGASVAANSPHPYYVKFGRADGTVFELSGYPGTDPKFCPTLSDLDVEFLAANQSSTTEVRLSFNTSDYIDPRTIVITGPDRINMTLATVVSVFADAGPYVEWTVTSGSVSQPGMYPLYTIGVDTRSPTNTNQTLPPGRHEIVLGGVILPRGNCTDLGDWGVSIGTLQIVENPVSDTVTSCVNLENLDVALSPDGEQGQIVDVTISFDVAKHQLSFVPGDSEYIRVVLPETLGASFTANSYFDSVLNMWTATAPPSIATREIIQYFTMGDTTYKGQRAQFTIKNVLLPNFCVLSESWLVEVGLWTIHMTPNTTDLVQCPVLDGFNFEWINSAACNPETSARVSFNVSNMRLRGNYLKVKFPLDSDITVWQHSTVVSGSGPGDWQAVGNSMVQPPYPLHNTPSYLINNPVNEVSFTQLLQGTPLEVGSYGFVLSGLGTPCNNCTELKDYQLSVDIWNTPYTNPTLDDLTCPYVIHRINITTEPAEIYRRYPNATYLFEFTVPGCGWNQLDLHFDDDFLVGLNAPVTVESVQNLDLSVAEITVVDNTIVSIFNVTDTCQYGDSYQVQVRVNNVGTPNHCNAPLFGIKTKTCGYVDRSVGHTSPIKECFDEHVDNSGQKRETQVAAVGCSICNACTYDFTDSLGQVVYNCYENGITFQRVALDGPEAPCVETQSFSTPDIF